MWLPKRHLGYVFDSANALQKYWTTHIFSPTHRIKSLKQMQQKNMNLIFSRKWRDNERKIAAWQTCRRAAVYFNFVIYTMSTPQDRRTFTQTCSPYKILTKTIIITNLQGIHNKIEIFIDTHMWPTGSSTERSICACVATSTLTSCGGVRIMAETPLGLGGKFDYCNYFLLVYQVLINYLF